jgi:hypothetical protein
LVPARSSPWVHIGWWDKLGSSVCAESDFPFAVVEEPVVPATDQHRVVEVGRPVLQPGDDVVAGGSEVEDTLRRRVELLGQRPVLAADQVLLDGPVLG